MKSLALTFAMALVLAVAGGAAAQQAPSSPPDSSAAPAPSQAPSDSKNTNVEVNIGGAAKPNTEAPGSAPVAPAPRENKFPEAKNDTNRPGASSGDDVAASPRSGSAPQSTIFGLSPVSAVVIAAALLVVVILAIVAMTRSDTTYIDTNRRI